MIFGGGGPSIVIIIRLPQLGSGDTLCFAPQCVHRQLHLRPNNQSLSENKVKCPKIQWDAN